MGSQQCPGANRDIIQGSWGLKCLAILSPTSTRQIHTAECLDSSRTNALEMEGPGPAPTLVAGNLPLISVGAASSPYKRNSCLRNVLHYCLCQHAPLDPFQMHRQQGVKFTKIICVIFIVLWKRKVAHMLRTSVCTILPMEAAACPLLLSVILTHGLTSSMRVEALWCKGLFLFMP